MCFSVFCYFLSSALCVNCCCVKVLYKKIWVEDLFPIICLQAVWGFSARQCDREQMSEIFFIISSLIFPYSVSYWSLHCWIFLELQLWFMFSKPFLLLNFTGLFFWVLHSETQQFVYWGLPSQKKFRLFHIYTHFLIKSPLHRCINVSFLRAVLRSVCV